MDFSKRLKKSRMQKGFTQKHMGDALGMDAKSYQKYELSLREPNLEKLAAIARLLNVSVDYLIGLTDSPDSLQLYELLTPHIFCDNVSNTYLSIFKKERFAERLNLLMNQRGVSKQSLATAISISRPAVSQFANGVNMPSVENLVAIAKFFDVSVDYLLGLDDHSYKGE